jgi:hypothetical protein
MDLFLPTSIATGLSQSIAIQKINSPLAGERFMGTKILCYRTFGSGKWIDPSAGDLLG